MGPSKKPVGHIHRIREFELEKVILSDEFDILQIVGEGWFGKILLVEHRATDTEMVLKALPKPYVSLRDFYREFHYGLHLGVHRNIVTTYDVAFETAGFYVFTQEYAPLGDLTSNVLETGIGELHTKRVAKQIASALEFMHTKELVHRDVKLDNVLVCRSDFSRVKLCDFGESRRANTLVQRRNEWLPYSPPEVLLVNTDESYKTIPSHDIWQFGIVIFVCLTGCLPWQKAAPDDPRYIRYIAWQSTSALVIPMKRTPKLFKLITSKACKMFRKFLEPNPDRRPKNFADLQNFLDDRWLTKGAEKNLVVTESDELCASMYSFHSSPEEKNKLLSTLAQHGIETTVDRIEKKKRIRDWIQSSVIMEEEDEDDSGTTTPSSTHSRTPVAGHVSSVRAMEESVKKITTTVKDASSKHIDPRTGLIQQGPSEMGDSKNARQNENFNNPSNQNLNRTSNQFLNVTESENLNGNNYETMVNGKLSMPIRNGQTTSSSSSSKGLLSIYNSVAMVSVPEVQQPIQLQPKVLSNRLDIVNNSIMDSGYGSLDKLKNADGNTVLTKRSASIRSAAKVDLLNNSKKPNQPNSFDSEDDGEDERGSSGFVNIIGIPSSSNNNNSGTSMKDTAYDRIDRNKIKSKK